MPTITLASASSIKINETLQSLFLCSERHKFDDMAFVSNVQTPYTTDIIPEIKSSNEYSSWIIHELNQHIETDFVLICQWDGWILDDSLWDDDYYNWDYIGNPWRYAHTSKGKRYIKISGQGGFSLRSKKLLMACAEIFKGETINFAEDRLITIERREELERRGIKFAPWEVAKKFSALSNEIGIVPSFGFHCPNYAKRLRRLSADELIPDEG